MPIYHAPVETALFVLRDVCNWDNLANLPGFADAPLETVEAILGEAGALQPRRCCCR